jgi:hypothetical protein
MKKRITYTVSVKVVVDVEVENEAQLEDIDAEHQHALYHSLTLDSNIEGTKTVNWVNTEKIEYAFYDEIACEWVAYNNVEPE